MFFYIFICFDENKFKEKVLFILNQFFLIEFSTKYFKVTTQENYRIAFNFQ